MKNLIYITLLCLLLFSCRNESNTIRILTDDLFILDTIDHFNAGSSELKVKVDFYNDDETDLFSYFKSLELHNYDLVAGSYNSETPLDSAFLKKVETKEFLKEESRAYYEPFYEFNSNNRGYGLLYALNFPVIINMEDNSHDINQKPNLTMEDFALIAGSTNINNSKSQKVAFIPSISSLDKLDYYFIFNSSIMISDEDITFTTENSRKAFNFYHNFNRDNFSKDELSAYLELYNNISRELYIERKILSFDFLDISEALALPLESHKINLIKGQRYLGLRNKVIAISKSSQSPKGASAFINYLISFETQKRLLISSQDNTIAHRDIHLPVIKNIFYTLDEFRFEPSLMESYLNSLAPIDFHNSKMQERFFSSYYYTSDMIEKEMINHENFLEYFSNQLKSKN